jgi:hypothetical protein
MKENEPPKPLDSAQNTASQSIAQSSAMALSDATDNLRNISSISTTAIGVALSRFIESGDMRNLEAIDQANKVVKNSIDSFKVIGDQVKNTIKF